MTNKEEFIKSLAFLVDEKQEVTKKRMNKNKSQHILTIFTDNTKKINIWLHEIIFVGLYLFFLSIVIKTILCVWSDNKSLQVVIKIIITSIMDNINLIITGLIKPVIDNINTINPNKEVVFIFFVVSLFILILKIKHPLFDAIKNIYKKLLDRFIDKP